MQVRYPLSAHYIKHSLNLAKVEQKNADLMLWRRERNLLIYKLSETQYLCAYAFGVVTVFGVDDKKEKEKYLRRFAKGGEEEPGVTTAALPSEEYPIVIDPDGVEALEFNFARLHQLDVNKLLLMFHVIAQSVAMEFIENQVEESLQRIEKIHLALQRRGKLVANTTEVMKTIGMSGNIAGFIYGQISLLDKPDIAWEEKDAEKLFLDLRKMFELEDRFGTLRFKLTFIQDSSELIFDALNTRRGQLLEMTIVLLIVFEIILAFFPGKG